MPNIGHTLINHYEILLPKPTNLSCLDHHQFFCGKGIKECCIWCKFKSIRQREAGCRKGWVTCNIFQKAKSKKPKGVKHTANNPGIQQNKKLCFSYKVYRTEKLSHQQVAAVEALRDAVPEIDFWNIPAHKREVKRGTLGLSYFAQSI